MTPQARLTRWILDHAHRVDGVPELMDGLVSELDACDLRMLRMTVQLPVLHPEVSVRMWIWRRAPANFELQIPQVIVSDSQTRACHGIVQTVDLGHEAWLTPAFRASPIHRVLVSGADLVVSCIAPAPEPMDFPILEDLRLEGGTGYLALALRSASGRGACTFASSKDGGFSPEDVTLLQDVMPLFTLALERHTARRLAEALLRTYVGSHAGAKVLQGKIRRGDVEILRAAIWFSDLRGFTTLCEQYDTTVVLGWLNAYFQLIARAVEAQGGEILKFIGDAVLAIFPFDTGSEAEACTRALSAAKASDAALDGLNAERERHGEPALVHGIGLHLGEALYGNIGATTRLDFTVIGPDVNLASRLEGLCARVERRLVVSSRFSKHAREPLEPLGAFTLKGVDGIVEAFTTP